MGKLGRSSRNIALIPRGAVRHLAACGVRFAEQAVRRQRSTAAMRLTGVARLSPSLISSRRDP